MVLHPQEPNKTIVENDEEDSPEKIKRFSSNNKEKNEKRTNNGPEDVNLASTRNTTTVEFQSKENIKKGESHDASSSSDSKYSQSEGTRRTRNELKLKKKNDQDFEGTLYDEPVSNSEKNKRGSEKSSVDVIDEETGRLLEKENEDEILSGSNKSKKDNSYHKVENIKFLADIAPNN